MDQQEALLDQSTHSPRGARCNWHHKACAALVTQISRTDRGARAEVKIVVGRELGSAESLTVRNFAAAQGSVVIKTKALIEPSSAPLSVYQR